jgi:hypothetical protein
MEQPGQKIVKFLGAQFAYRHTATKIFLQQAQIAAKGLNRMFRKTLPDHVIVIGAGGHRQRRIGANGFDLRNRWAVLPPGPALWKQRYLRLSHSFTSYSPRTNERLT